MLHPKTSISFTISTLHKICQTLILKALLLEGINSSYQSPSLRRHNYFLQKPFSWKTQILHTKALLIEGNTICNFTTTKKALLKGKII